MSLAEVCAQDYFSLTAKGGQVMVGWKKTGNPTDCFIKFSWDEKKSWSLIDDGQFIMINPGETYYFRHTESGPIDGLSKDAENYWSFTMIGNGTIEAAGNIMSLLDATCRQTTTAPYAFAQLFKGCKNLTEINMFNLPAITPANNAFEGWLNGTAEGHIGTLILPAPMIDKTTFPLPENWQWATKLTAHQNPDKQVPDFYTTFYDSRFSYTLPESFKAYSGSVVRGQTGDNLQLIPVPDNVIPSGEGVIINGPSSDFLVKVTKTEPDPLAGNALTGTNTAIPAPEHCHILSYGQHGLAFYLFTQTLTPMKAYLVYQQPAGAQALSMFFPEDDPTDIASLPSSIEDDSAPIYNLQGQRLNHLQKGINIIGGKKVLVK